MEVIHGYSVIPARKRHSETLSLLAATSFREAFGSAMPADDMNEYLAQAFNGARMLSDLQHPGIYMFLLMDGNGEAVGYSKITEEASPVPLGAKSWLSLERIYLRANQLGRGGRDTLMAHGLQVARDKNREVVWLGVWQENHRAIAFYKRWGFVVYGTKRFALGKTINDDYLMKKEL